MNKGIIMMILGIVTVLGTAWGEGYLLSFYPASTWQHDPIMMTTVICYLVGVLMIGIGFIVYMASKESR